MTDIVHQPRGFWPTRQMAQNNSVLRRRDFIAEKLLCWQIIGATFLQKAAIPLGGSAQGYVALIVMIAACIIGLMSRRLRVDPARFGIYMLMAGVLTMTQIAGGFDFSILSLIMLLITNLPYIFRLKSEPFHAPQVELNRTTPHIGFVFFRKTMALLAVLGIVQYFAQYVVGTQVAFFLDKEIPHAFIYQGFHNLNPMGYGSSVYKSNGVFLLEPSMFSQFLAVAIVAEMMYFHSWKYLALFGAGMLVTFSGTGFVILGILAPIYLIQKRQYAILFLALIVVSTAGLWAPLVGLETTVGRAAEFTNSNTSGYARFVSIFRLIHDFILPRTNSFLFGQGAGSVSNMASQVNYAVHDPSWGKIMFEYGVVGFLAWLLLIVQIIRTSPAPFYIKAALAIQFFFLGEYALAPTVHGLMLGLLAWPAPAVVSQDGPTNIQGEKRRE